MSWSDGVISRRNFCAGLASLIVAPYVIRNSGVLMPVRDRSLSLSLVYGLHSDPWQNHVNLPIGAIYPFLGKPPKGWLPFDGRTIRKEQYPELFKLTSLNKWPAVKLSMLGGQSIPTLEAVPSVINDHSGWWAADAQILLRDQTG